MTSGDPVPDAVAALIAAVLVDHPGASPERLGRLVVAQLRRDGWRVCAPTGRATTTAVHPPATRELTPWRVEPPPAPITTPQPSEVVYAPISRRFEAQMSYTETPTRQQAAWRCDLTLEQTALADQLHTRANHLRAGAAADGESLSIREAVELAAVQLGVAL